MRIAVVGSGYVGLVTGACLAETGSEVTVVDIDSAKIAKLQHGEIPIYEPGLDDLVKRNITKARLRFTTDMSEAVAGCQAVFIAVGTPPGAEGAADLDQVLFVAEEIGRLIDSYTVVVTKSTVPVGTAARVRAAVEGALNERGLLGVVEFDVASNPEFLKEGAAIADFLRPDRIVIGVESERAQAVLERIYRPFLLNAHPVIFMDVASAEITKYAANAMLATRISFMNSIAALCEAVGADVSLVRRGMGADPRIGPGFLYAGAGYGGSCFGKDVRALAHTARELGLAMPIVEATDQINEAQKRSLVAKLRAAWGVPADGALRGRKVGVWGLAFKPNTDDVREAPAITVVTELLEAGAEVALFDPVALDHAMALFDNNVTLVNDKLDAANDADAVILVTEWPELRTVDPAVLASRMRGRLLIDGRNVLDEVELAAAGFTVIGVGRPVCRPAIG